jgi:hypothetical protein
MEASVLLPLWRSGDVESLPDVLAEHATFSSPVTDHNGQAKAAHMLGLIARVRRPARSVLRVAAITVAPSSAATSTAAWP